MKAHSRRKNAARDSRGQMIPILLVVSSIAVMFITGFASWAAINLKALRLTRARELALLVAESGQEYYRWHLAHAPSDFKDGTNTAGPYMHTFNDKDGNALGSYSLTITPPPIGSTVVVIKSTGTVLSDPSVKRIVQVILAKPSLAKYAVVADDVMRFGAGTEVFGPVHSNNGIHFDGLAHNVITSAVSTYNDPDYAGSPTEFGVYTRVSPQDPQPPSAVPSRPDVFEAGRQFPVPAVDFAGISADLAQMKADAQAAGQYFAPSGALGYHIVLKTDGTFDLSKVTSLTPAPSGCNSDGSSGWGTWSIAAQSVPTNYTFPTNGVIFTEDHVWVDGQINGARITIAAAKFPESPATYRSITVNNDLRYTNYDGSDSIALISQGNFNVGFVSADSLRIDGAVLSQYGRVGRYYYGASCTTYYTRTALTLYGMIATALRYGFAYTDGTGYATRTLTYDAIMLYAPPPDFPLTSNQYQLLSWKELNQ